MATQQGVVGIQNMGNTCYANATLQLLRACTEWDYFCLQDSKNNESKATEPKRRILTAYQEINRSLWSAKYPAYVRPLGFLHAVGEAVKGTVYDSFGMSIPNDSHEYLVYLLDQFHESLNCPLPIYSSSSTPIDNRDEVAMMHARAAEGWARYRSKDNSPVVDLFFGMMRKMVTCHGCGNKTYRWEVFNVLSVPCKGASFIDWIRATEEQIEGFACDGCHGRHPATIHSALWSLPPNLFVTLQRFEPNGMKNMTACPYQGEPLRFEFAPESPNAQDTYELRGIVDHHGTHRGGHYTAQWKHPKSQEWWWYDDEKARPMPTPQPSTPSAYIMFFRKT